MKTELFQISFFPFFRAAVNVNERSVPLMLMFVIECFKFEEMRNYFLIIENKSRVKNPGGWGKETFGLGVPKFFTFN